MIELSYNKKDLNKYLRLSLKWWSIWPCAKEKTNEKTPYIYISAIVLFIELQRQVLKLLLIESWNTAKNQWEQRCHGLLPLFAGMAWGGCLFCKANKSISA